MSVWVLCAIYFKNSNLNLAHQKSLILSPSASLLAAHEEYFYLLFYQIWSIMHPNQLILEESRLISPLLPRAYFLSHFGIWDLRQKNIVLWHEKKAILFMRSRETNLYIMNNNVLHARINFEIFRRLTAISFVWPYLPYPDPDKVFFEIKIRLYWTS